MFHIIKRHILCMKQFYAALLFIYLFFRLSVCNAWQWKFMLIIGMYSGSFFFPFSFLPVIVGWIPWEVHSKMEFSMQNIKECPWHQQLWKERKGRGFGQRKKLSNAVPTTVSADPIGSSEARMAHLSCPELG